MLKISGKMWCFFATMNYSDEFFVFHSLCQVCNVRHTHTHRRERTHTHLAHTLLAHTQVLFQIFSTGRSGQTGRHSTGTCGQTGSCDVRPQGIDWYVWELRSMMREIMDFGKIQDYINLWSRTWQMVTHIILIKMTLWKRKRSWLPESLPERLPSPERGRCATPFSGFVINNLFHLYIHVMINKIPGEQFQYVAAIFNLRSVFASILAQMFVHTPIYPNFILKKKEFLNDKGEEIAWLQELGFWESKNGKIVVMQCGLRAAV